jgi:hypothetical protein
MSSRTQVVSSSDRENAHSFNRWNCNAIIGQRYLSIQYRRTSFGPLVLPSKPKSQLLWKVRWRFKELK